MEYSLRSMEAETDVSAVLLQFGPNRLKKAPDMSVAKFYHLWLEQLPECMLPSDAAENVKFVDLIKRALFYFCLEDKFLQEQLCNLKNEDITLKTFFDEALVAEQKRKAFQEIGVSSSHLDSSAGVVSVNKWETKSDKSGSAGRGKSAWRGRSVKGGGSVARGGGARVYSDDSSRPDQGVRAQGVRANSPPPAQQVQQAEVKDTTGVRRKKKSGAKKSI